MEEPLRPAPASDLGLRGRFLREKRSSACFDRWRRNRIVIVRFISMNANACSAGDNPVGARDEDEEKGEGGEEKREWERGRHHLLQVKRDQRPSR